MSRQSSRDASPLVFGALPRAQLMPPEYAVHKRETAQRRSLIVLATAVVALVIGGVVVLYVLAAGAQERLEAERAITQQLLVEQQQYAEVVSIQERLATVDAQRDSLAGVEVLWQDELRPFLAALGSGATIDAMTVTGNVPLESVLALEDPLRTPRSATVLLTVATSSLPDSSRWLREWEELEGYADASINSIAADGDEGYLTVVTLNLSSAVLANQEVAE